MIMDRLAETDPQIEYSQTAANSAHEAITQSRAQIGIAPEKPVGGPLQAPGKKHQKHPDHGAQNYEEKHGDAACPKS
jgi:hypothetical protein